MTDSSETKRADPGYGVETCQECGDILSPPGTIIWRRVEGGPRFCSEKCCKAKRADTPRVDSKGIPYDTRGGPKDRRKRHDRSRKQDQRSNKGDSWSGERKIRDSRAPGWRSELLLGDDEIDLYYCIPSGEWKKCHRYKSPKHHGRRCGEWRGTDRAKTERRRRDVG